jgi:hypothetical protein
MRMLAIEQLRAAVAAGPPLEPSPQMPGPHLSALRELIADFEKCNARPPAPQDVVQLFAHLFDRNLWRAQMADYERMVNLLQQAERRVEVVR